MKNLHLILAVWISVCLNLPATTETEADLRCGRVQAVLAAGDSTDRQYAPDLDFRLLHLALDVTPDFQRRTIESTATIRFRPNVLPATELRLDAIDLRVHAVTSSEKIKAYQVTEDSIVVTFAEEIPPDREATLTISYEAEPQQGLYFRTPEMGYKQGDTHLFSQGESILARHWYPCVDAPNVMFTSEVTCRVAEGMTVVSNGRLVSDAKDETSGLRAFHWVQEQPHANYLVTLVAGFFHKIEDHHGDIPLAFLTPATDSAYASNSFRGTREMMEFFERDIGIPYPWPKYYQVCVNDFVAGGMENTSATTLTDNTLFSNDTENIHDSEGLVAHELAHQWFGDLVTCKDWSHLWLNEGFATYYEVLWQGHRHGRDELLYELYQNAQTILRAGGNPTPIVRRTYGQPDEMFGYLAYQKGGWILHMLRAQLGDEMYQKSVRLLLERHRHGNVVTEDFRRIIEEVSGRSYDQFFDQWLYHAHHPELDVTYSWDQTAELVRLSVRQVQRLGTNVLLFNVPLCVRFKGKDGVIDRTIRVSKAEEDFSFPLKSAPDLVRLDPRYELLAKINFSTPSAMLEAQLTDQADLIGRLQAIEILGKRRDRDAIAKLKRALKEDSHYGARLAACRALGAMRTDESLEALLECTAQTDARVRRQVLENIGDFYCEPAYKLLTKTLKEEKNPAIQASALRNIAGFAKPGIRETIEGFLGAQSYGNELTDAAIAALRLQDDPASIPALLRTLSNDAEEFSGGGYSRGLTALAYLARNEDDKQQVREFLVQQLDNKRRGVKVATLNALGTLGDPRAVGVVEKFATSARENRERSAAETALNTLRAARRPVDDFKNLRQEVLELQKADRELRKELEDLKKKLKEAAPVDGANGQPQPPPPATAPRSKPVPPKSPELRSPKNIT